ncbi:MAG TPA: type II secretion system minor pseudopilin GspJ [Marinobacter sp.]|nr:type II secretion system minor pseudopilin GspJ [Marinobacter sp.]
MNPRRFAQAAPQRGFTLMEMLIAVTITAVIGLGVWQVVSGVVKSRDRVNELADEFDNLQKTMLFLERDITQVVNRPVRDVYGDFELALSTRDDAFVLKITRQGWRNPLGLRRSSLQRVAWEFTGTELRRRYWPVLDEGQEDSSRDLLLLEDLLELEIRFIDHRGNRHEHWPSDEAMASLSLEGRPAIPLPRGMEITLEHEYFGELVRTFTLPDFDAEQAQGIISQQREASENDTDDEAADEQAAESAEGV